MKTEQPEWAAACSTVGFTHAVRALATSDRLFSRDEKSLCYRVFRQCADRAYDRSITIISCHRSICQPHGAGWTGTVFRTTIIYRAAMAAVTPIQQRTNIITSYTRSNPWPTSITDLPLPRPRSNAFNAMFTRVLHTRKTGKRLLPCLITAVCIATVRVCFVRGHCRFANECQQTYRRYRRY